MAVFRERSRCLGADTCAASDFKQRATERIVGRIEGREGGGKASHVGGQQSRELIRIRGTTLRSWPDRPLPSLSPPLVVERVDRSWDAGCHGDPVTAADVRWTVNARTGKVKRTWLVYSGNLYDTSSHLAPSGRELRDRYILSTIPNFRSRVKFSVTSQSGYSRIEKSRIMEGERERGESLEG